MSDKISNSDNLNEVPDSSKQNTETAVVSCVNTEFQKHEECPAAVLPPSIFHSKVNSPGKGPDQLVVEKGMSLNNDVLTTDAKTSSDSTMNPVFVSSNKDVAEKPLPRIVKDQSNGSKCQQNNLLIEKLNTTDVLSSDMHSEEIEKENVCPLTGKKDVSLNNLPLKLTLGNTQEIKETSYSSNSNLEEHFVLCSDIMQEECNDEASTSADLSSDTCSEHKCRNISFISSEEFKACDLPFKQIPKCDFQTEGLLSNSMSEDFSPLSNDNDGQQPVWPSDMCDFSDSYSKTGTDGTSNEINIHLSSGENISSGSNLLLPQNVPLQEICIMDSSDILPIGMSDSNEILKAVPAPSCDKKTSFQDQGNFWQGRPSIITKFDPLLAEADAVQNIISENETLAQAKSPVTDYEGVSFSLSTAVSKSSTAIPEPDPSLLISETDILHKKSETLLSKSKVLQVQCEYSPVVIDSLSSEPKDLAGEYGISSLETEPQSMLKVVLSENEHVELKCLPSLDLKGAILESKFLPVESEILLSESEALKLEHEFSSVVLDSSSSELKNSFIDCKASSLENESQFKPVISSLDLKEVTVESKHLLVESEVIPSERKLLQAECRYSSSDSRDLTADCKDLLLETNLKSELNVISSNSEFVELDSVLLSSNLMEATTESNQLPKSELLLPKPGFLQAENACSSTVADLSASEAKDLSASEAKDFTVGSEVLPLETELTSESLVILSENKLLGLDSGLSSSLMEASTKPELLPQESKLLLSNPEALEVEWRYSPIVTDLLSSESKGLTDECKILPFETKLQSESQMIPSENELKLDSGLQSDLMEAAMGSELLLKESEPFLSEPGALQVEREYSSLVTSSSLESESLMAENKTSLIGSESQAVSNLVPVENELSELESEVSLLNLKRVITEPKILSLDSEVFSESKVLLPVTDILSLQSEFPPSEISPSTIQCLPSESVGLPFKTTSVMKPQVFPMEPDLLLESAVPKMKMFRSGSESFHSELTGPKSELEVLHLESKLLPSESTVLSCKKEFSPLKDKLLTSQSEGPSVESELEYLEPTALPEKSEVLLHSETEFPLVESELLPDLESDISASEPELAPSKLEQLEIESKFSTPELTSPLELQSSLEHKDPTPMFQGLKNDVTCDHSENHLKTSEIQSENLLKEDEKGSLISIHNIQEEIAKLSKEKDTMRQVFFDLRDNINEVGNVLASGLEEQKLQRIKAAKYRKSLVADRDEALEDIHNVEKAFLFLSTRYTTAKAVLEQMKQNEIILQQEVDRKEEQISANEEKYNFLQCHANEQMDVLNDELLKFQKDHDAEKAALTAMLRRSEIKLRSCTTTLEQAEKENVELTRMCEELGYKLNP